MVVSSFGSINIDKVVKIDSDKLEELLESDNFPEKGETKEYNYIPDFVKDFDFNVFLGGKGANQAVASAKAGSKTKLFGKIGEDSKEYRVLQKLQNRGVDTGKIVYSEKKTGCTYIFVDEKGENRICLIEGANKDVDKNYVDLNYAEILKSRVLLLQNEISIKTNKYLLDRLNKEPKKDKPYIIFDPSPVKNSEEIIKHKAINMITPNEVEYKKIYEHIDKHEVNLLKTLGEEGVKLNNTIIKPPKTDPIDTTAAGDVLNGYIANGINKEKNIKKTTKTAVKAASLSTTKNGAQKSIPTKKQLKNQKQ